jgi:hypothetical protein
VTALLGNGKGGFDGRMSRPTGDNPKAIAILDVDRDGKLDLVTANYDADSVRVLLGKGDGNFDSAGEYAVGHGPVAMAHGDFNGDGIEDIATANNDAGMVSVLLGSGYGTFATKEDYATGSYPTAIFTADFDDNGKADLAITCNSVVNVLLGVGDGSFIYTPDSPTGAGGVSAVALGDPNSDGKLDLIVGRSSGRYSSGVFGVLFGVRGLRANVGSFLQNRCRGRLERRRQVGSGHVGWTTSLEPVLRRWQWHVDRRGDVPYASAARPSGIWRFQRR